MATVLTTAERAWLKAAIKRAEATRRAELLAASLVAEGTKVIGTGEPRHATKATRMGLPEGTVIPDGYTPEQGMVVRSASHWRTGELAAERVDGYVVKRGEHKGERRARARICQPLLREKDTRHIDGPKRRAYPKMAGPADLYTPEEWRDGTPRKRNPHRIKGEADAQRKLGAAESERTWHEVLRAQD